LLDTREKKKKRRGEKKGTGGPVHWRFMKEHLCEQMLWRRKKKEKGKREKYKVPGKSCVSMPRAVAQSYREEKKKKEKKERGESGGKRGKGGRTPRLVFLDRFATNIKGCGIGWSFALHSSKGEKRKKKKRDH